jgi:hypothetical protein
LGTGQSFRSHGIPSMTIIISSFIIMFVLAHRLEDSFVERVPHYPNISPIAVCNQPNRLLSLSFHTSLVSGLARWKPRAHEAVFHRLVLPRSRSHIACSRLSARIKVSLAWKMLTVATVISRVVELVNDQLDLKSFRDNGNFICLR